MNQALAVQVPALQQRFGQVAVPGRVQAGKERQGLADFHPVQAVALLWHITQGGLVLVIDLVGRFAKQPGLTTVSLA
ncbi:hypothetical protein D3C84_969400 [compost metagenome]